MTGWLPPKTIVTTGSAGTATGSVTFEGVFGYWAGLIVDYSPSAPATTDLTVTEVLPSGKERTVFTNTSSVTDLDVIVRKASVDTANAATGQKEPIFISGDLRFSFAQCDALAAAAVIYVQVEGSRT